MPLELESISKEFIIDESPDLSYLEQDYEDCTKQEAIKHKAQDENRLQRYNDGYWHMIGIKAKAKIRINGIFETVTSGGLWGIESDSDQKYFDEVFEEQKSELIDMLKEIGISQDQIAEAAN